MFFLGL